LNKSIEEYNNYTKTYEGIMQGIMGKFY
jgi:hypothetical protein